MWVYIKNWATKLAIPNKIRKLWKTADGQRRAPRRLKEIMWIKEGNTNTKAKPHVAPENLKQEIIATNH